MNLKKQVNVVGVMQIRNTSVAGKRSVGVSIGGFENECVTGIGDVGEAECRCLSKFLNKGWVKLEVRT